MALDIVVHDLGFQSVINWKLKGVAITLDDSYPSGGWPITHAELGMDSVVLYGMVNGAGFPVELIPQVDGSALLKIYKDLGTEETVVDAHDGEVLQALVVGY